MCIPHGALGTQSNGFQKEDKPKKHVARVSQSEFEKGDPNFIDERISENKIKKKESFFFNLFSS